VSRILIVEDEHNLALGLRANLEVESHEVVVAGDGESALAAVDAFKPELVILDLMLPGIDGYEILERLRSMGVNVPVLILSARAEEIDKVRGFRTGADDYVTKPFGVMELMLRVQALLRRSAVPPSPTRFAFGEVTVDVENRMAWRAGREVVLTPRAFDLLLALIDKIDRPVTRQELLRTVWQYDSSVSTRTVDAHVAELRRKLEVLPGEPKHILTVHRVGYRLRA
jgi:two-component system response regulator MtrA